MRQNQTPLHTLNTRHIIDDTFHGYKVVKLAEKCQSKVIDQITIIREELPCELKIFKTWIEWFRSKNVPYVITYYKKEGQAYGVYKLWKEFFPEPKKGRKR